mgnify:CR=1 FL=1
MIEVDALAIALPPKTHHMKNEIERGVSVSYWHIATVTFIDLPCIMGKNQWVISNEKKLGLLYLFLPDKNHSGGGLDSVETIELSQFNVVGIGHAMDAIDHHVLY